MGQFLAAMINREDLLADALRHEISVLGRDTIADADGWGVGFYQAGEVLHRKRPHSAGGPLAWSTVVEGLRAHVAVVHVRNATVGDRRAENTHPFRMRQWLFAHVGELGGFSATRKRIASALPDFLQRNLRGDTDSEHIFHVFLSFLHDAGQLDVVDAQEGKVQGAIRSTIALLDRHATQVGAPPGGLTCVLTNGRELYVVRRGCPLWLAERTDLPARDSAPERESSAAKPVRYVMLATAAPQRDAPEHDATRPPPGYREVPEAHIVTVHHDLTVSIDAL